jgi:hypothetical protein
VPLHANGLHHQQGFVREETKYLGQDLRREVAETL